MQSIESHIHYNLTVISNCAIIMKKNPNTNYKLIIEYKYIASYKDFPFVKSDFRTIRIAQLCAKVERSL